MPWQSNTINPAVTSPAGDITKITNDLQVLRGVIGGAPDAGVPSTWAGLAQIQSQAAVAFTTAGTLTAYTLTPTPAIGAYAAGLSFFVTFHAASGASPTLQISGLGSPPQLVRQLPDGAYANIAAGEIPINHRSRVTLLSPTQALVEEMPPVSARNRNRFANGAFVFDQRHAGAAVSVNSAAETRALDCLTGTGRASGGVFTVQRIATGGPVGSPTFVRCTVTTADASIPAANAYFVRALLEGFDTADLGWGAAGALPISVGFWFRASITGTFSGSVQNPAATRSYPVSWSYSTANVWQFVPVQNIPGDTTGTWPATNVRSMQVNFCLGGGTSAVGPANAWAASSAVGVTGTTNLMATSGATFDLAAAQVESGIACTPIESVPYQTGLARVQRYYWEIGRTGAIDNPLVGFQVSTNIIDFLVACPVPMRSAPTINSSAWTFSSGASPVGNQIACYDFTAAGFLTSTHSSIVGSWVGSADRQHGFLRFTGSGGVFGGAGGRAVQLATGATAFINLSSDL